MPSSPSPSPSPENPPATTDSVDTPNPYQPTHEPNNDDNLNQNSNVHNQVLCVFHASGCNTNGRTNATMDDLADRSSALSRATIKSGLAPELLNLLDNPDEFVNRAIRDGATSALMSITPPSMGEAGAALASINDRAENDPVLSKVFNLPRSLTSRNEPYSPDSPVKKSAQLGELSTLIKTLNPGSKVQPSGEQNNNSQEFGLPVFDIWHSKTTQNIFEIVSERIAQVSNQLN